MNIICNRENYTEKYPLVDNFQLSTKGYHRGVNFIKTVEISMLSVKENRGYSVAKDFLCSLNIS